MLSSLLKPHVQVSRWRSESKSPGRRRATSAGKSRSRSPVKQQNNTGGAKRPKTSTRAAEEGRAVRPRSAMRRPQSGLGAQASSRSVRFSKLFAPPQAGSGAASPCKTQRSSPAEAEQREARLGLNKAMCQPKGSMWKPISADTYGMELSTNPYSLDHPEALTRWQPKVHGYKKEDWEAELRQREMLAGLPLDDDSSEVEETSSRSPSPARRRGSHHEHLVAPVPASGWWEADQSTPSYSNGIPPKADALGDADCTLSPTAAAADTRATYRPSTASRVRRDHPSPSRPSSAFTGAARPTSARCVLTLLGDDTRATYRPVMRHNTNAGPARHLLGRLLVLNSSRPC
jgi:hypothetical protein